ncbi:MAG: ATP-binding protein [Myxococcota bacterium]
MSEGALVAAASLLVILGGLLFLRYRRKRAMAGDLAALRESALAYADGKAAARFAVRSEGEIADLARALEIMRAGIDAARLRTREERDRLRETLGAMREGVLMLDEAGTVIQVNPALRSLIDLPADPLGRKIVELLRAPAFQELLDEGFSGETPALREVTLRRAGTDRRFLVRLVQLRRAGRPSGAVLVFRDVTETRRLEKMRSDFIANVSHELKTPLTAIRGYAETLSETPPGDPAQSLNFLRTILRHANRLSALVDDLLELSRIEGGEAPLNPEPVELAPCVNRVLQAVAPGARRRNVSFTAAIDDSLPAIHADPRALETILSNLVNNAAKYADEGGHVTVRARAEEGTVRIEVADSGPGIPPEHLPRLFERFYRVDASRSREQGGTGLGLAIVKHLCQALGGRAEVDSAPGRGSVFGVVLPAAQTPPPA